MGNKGSNPLPSSKIRECGVVVAQLIPNQLARVRFLAFSPNNKVL